MMEGILIASATGGSKDNWIYDYLRGEFIKMSKSATDFQLLFEHIEI